MKTKVEYYQQKGLEYGIGETRLRKIMELMGDAKNLRVLDVGCATGYLGDQIKKMGNTVDGVEVSSVASERAREKLDSVVTFDIEQKWPGLAHEPYDMIVMAEIIEHVFDPFVALKQAASKLKQGGSLIITTPNFLKWTHRIKFLFGRFAYTDQGALDFGHIRHFTYRYLKEALTESGFTIEKENHIFFPGKLTRVIKFWPSIFASQFIVKARKKHD